MLVKVAVECLLLAKEEIFHVFGQFILVILILNVYRLLKYMTKHLRKIHRTLILEDFYECWIIRRRLRAHRFICAVLLLEVVII